MNDEDILKLFGPDFPKDLYEEAKDFIRFFTAYHFYMPHRHKNVRKWIIDHYDKKTEKFTKEKQKANDGRRTLLATGNRYRVTRRKKDPDSRERDA